jgi:hypothetical protein
MRGLSLQGLTEHRVEVGDEHAAHPRLAARLPSRERADRIGRQDVIVLGALEEEA